MTDERWKEVAEKIRNAFPDHEYEKESILDGRGIIESFEFEGPAGMMKLERTKRPRIVGEKGMVAHRIGAESTIEKVYSDEDTVDFVTVYQWNDTQDTWVQMDDDSLLSAL
ncbi:MAG: hypothetical protein WCV86_02795 [Patescibacteria group bacterium]|jgi:hypothetical protein